MTLKLRKMLCIALALLCLAGCGKGADVTGGGSGKLPFLETANCGEAVGNWSGRELWPTFSRTPVAAAREGLYFFGSDFNGESSTHTLMLLPCGGSEAEFIMDRPEKSIMLLLCSGGEGAYMVTSSHNDELGEILLCRRDGSMESVAEFEAGIYFPSALCVAGGRIFLKLSDVYEDKGHKLLVFSQQGEREAEIPLPDGIHAMVSDGERVFLTQPLDRKGEVVEISELDVETLELRPIAQIEGGTPLAGCDGSRLFFYDSVSAYEYDMDTGEFFRLLDWTACGVPNGNGAKIFVDGDDLIVSCLLDGSMRLSPRDGSRQLVVLAVNGTASRYSYAAIAFNDSSEVYELVIKDYGNYADPQLMLGADLASDTRPDLIDALSFSPELLRAGVMTDLSELLSSDADMSEDDLLSGPLNAMRSSDGGLYAIAPLFLVETFLRLAEDEGALSAGAREFNGVIPSLEALGDAGAAFGGNLDRGDFLRLAFCRAGAEEYGEEELAAILEYAAALPETASYEEHGSASYQRFGAAEHLIPASLNAFGGGDMRRLEVFGLPFFEGTGLLLPQASLSIPAGAGEAQGAWEFIKSMIRGEGLENWLGNDFSLLKANYEAQNAGFADIAAAGKVNLPYESNGIWADFTVGAADCADCFELCGLILDGLGGVELEDTAAMGIVQDAAAAFFAGEASADEAARAVRSRLELYLGEKYG